MTSSALRIQAQQLDCPGLPRVVVVSAGSLDRRTQRGQRAIEDAFAGGVEVAQADIVNAQSAGRGSHCAIP